MESNEHAGVGTVPAHARLIQMGLGYWASRLVYVAARLGLADHLAGGPKNAAELSELTHTHASSLHRVTRAGGSRRPVGG